MYQQIINNTMQSNPNIEYSEPKSDHEPGIEASILFIFKSMHYIIRIYVHFIF